MELVKPTRRLTVDDVLTMDSKDLVAIQEAEDDNRLLVQIDDIARDDVEDYWREYVQTSYGRDGLKHRSDLDLLVGLRWNAPKRLWDDFSTTAPTIAPAASTPAPEPSETKHLTLADVLTMPRSELNKLEVSESKNKVKVLFNRTREALETLCREHLPKRLYTTGMSDLTDLNLAADLRQHGSPEMLSILKVENPFELDEAPAAEAPSSPDPVEIKHLTVSQILKMDRQELNILQMEEADNRIQVSVDFPRDSLEDLCRHNVAGGWELDLESRSDLTLVADLRQGANANLLDMLKTDDPFASPDAPTAVLDDASIPEREPEREVHYSLGM